MTQTRLGRFEGCGGAVALSGEASDLFALVAILVASLRDIIKSKRAAGRPQDLAVLPVLERTLNAKEED